MSACNRVSSYLTRFFLIGRGQTARAITALCLVALATIASRSVEAQQLVLTAEVSKSTFFEDEPIYLLVRLENVGTDTAWTFVFDLFNPAVTLLASRGHGSPAPLNKPIVDYLLPPPSWRGEPVPPGARILKTIVLQDVMGDEWDLRSHLLMNHIPSDDYELRVQFDAHWAVPYTAPLTLATSPVVFRVRARTPAEENEVRELEAMRRMGWDTTRVAGHPRAAGYKATLLRWVDRRLKEQPEDPFLPFLLYDGLYTVGFILDRQIQEGRVARFDPDTSEVVSRLRLAVIDRNKGSTAGAYLVQGLSARHSDQLAGLAEELANTPSGQMARYHVERIQHAQQSRQQRPH